MKRCARNSSREATLVLGILTVQSSYAQSVEEPAAGVPDTIQWWFLPDTVWRLRTYAVDRDLHPHRIDGVDVDFAAANTRKHYGDVLRELRVLRFSDLDSAKSVRSVLRAAGLRESVKYSESGIPLWLPEDAVYESRTVPR